MAKATSIPIEMCDIQDTVNIGLQRLTPWQLEQAFFNMQALFPTFQIFFLTGISNLMLLLFSSIC